MVKDENGNVNCTNCTDCVDCTGCEDCDITPKEGPKND